MIELTKGQTAEKIVVTLEELVSLVNPNFLFVFTHVETKQQVKFIRTPAQEESDYTYRYNKYEVDTESLFGEKPRGSWDYIVYEQVSSSNLDPAGLSAVEYGKMILYDESEFEFEQFDEAVTYKAFNG